MARPLLYHLCLHCGLKQTGMSENATPRNNQPHVTRWHVWEAVWAPCRLFLGWVLKQTGEVRPSVSTPADPADPADPSLLSSVNQEDYGRKDHPLRSQAVSLRSIFKTSKSLKLGSIIDFGVLSKQGDNVLTPHLQPSLTCFPSLPQSSSGRGAVKLLPLARYEVLDNRSFELQSWRRWRNQRLWLRIHTHSHQPRLKV